MSKPIPEYMTREQKLEAALKQLLHEVIEAGFETARDYGWPKAIADARAALALPALRTPLHPARPVRVAGLDE